MGLTPIGARRSVGSGPTPDMSHRVTPDEASAYYSECAQAVEDVDDALDHAHALIQSIIQTVAWESFTPEQRVALAEWGRQISDSRKTLRLPDV